MIMNMNKIDIKLRIKDYLINQFNNKDDENYLNDIEKDFSS